MLKFWLIRIRNNFFYLALFIGITLSISQLYFKVNTLSSYNDIIFTPYTSWLSMDFSGFSIVAFFLSLPLLASLSCSSIYKEDTLNGIINHCLINKTYTTYFKELLFLNFIIGSSVIIIPLLLNFFGSFLLLPNIHPDEIINYNINMTRDGGKIFVDLYYSHPMVHALLNIILCGIFGGLLATFSLSISFFINNKFVVILSSFFLQLFLLAINLFAFPFIAISPFTFLPENAFVMPQNIIVTLFFGLTLLVSTLVIFLVGVKKNGNY